MSVPQTEVTGRLAPRWIEDLAARLIPEIEKVIAPQVSIRLSSCGHDGRHRHSLAIVRNQSTLEGTSPAVVSLVCRQCDHHFVINIQSDSETVGDVCNHGQPNYSASVSDLPVDSNAQLAHHLIMSGQWTEEQCRQRRSQTYPLIGRIEYTCSLPRCPLQVSLEISEPRLTLEWLQLLNDPGRLKWNLEEARRKDPERYATAPDETVENAFKVLDTYLKNLLADPVTRSISKRNKRFQVVFGSELLPLFYSLGYTEKNSENNGVPEDFLEPSALEPANKDAPIPLDSLRAFIDNMQVEISNHYGPGVPDSYNATPRLQKELHCYGFRTTVPRSNIPSDEEDFLLLGVLPSMHPTLIQYGFECQRATSPGMQTLCANAFGRVADRLGNNELLGQAGMALSMLESEISGAGNQGVSQDHALIWEAAEYFGLSQPTEEPDYRLVQRYKDKRAQDSATTERYMTVLAKHRSSKRLQELLAGGMSLETAASILSLPSNGATMSDEIIKVYASSARNVHVPVGSDSNDPDWNAEVAEAVRVFAEARGSDFLLMAAIEMTQNGPSEDILATDSAAVTEVTKLDTPVGLGNIGNTCYLNSCLQVLYSITPLRDLLIHGQDRMIDLNVDDISTRRIGATQDPLTPIEACLGQLFTRELRDLYQQFASTPQASIRPSQCLAESALISAGAVAQDLEKRNTENAQKRKAGEDTALEAPPIPPRRPSSSAEHIEHVEHKEDVDMINVSVDAVSDTASNGSSKTLVDDTLPSAKQVEPVESTTAADSPPGLVSAPSEDVEMKDTAVTSFDSLDPDARMQAVQQSCKRLTDRASGTAQQDVEETMGSMLSLIQFAVKPDRVTESGIQRDLITDLFYLERKYYTRKNAEDDFRCSETSIDRSIVAYPSADGPCTIYEALGRSLDLEVLDGGQQRFSTLANLPPVLFIHIQRTKFDGNKNSNPVMIEDMIYLDRFTESDPNSELMTLRRCAWQLQDRLGQLSAIAPRQKPANGPSHRPVVEAPVVEDILMDDEVTESLFADQPAAKLQLSSEVFDLATTTPPPELAAQAENEEDIGTLSVEGLPSLSDIEKMSEQSIVELREAINRLFLERQSEAYRLHAVICHSGGMAAGHYWVWIHDGKNATWRKYNDANVTAEPNLAAVFDALNQGDAPYFLCYVRNDVRDEYVSVPARTAQDVEPPSAANNDTSMGGLEHWASEGTQPRPNTPLDESNDMPPPYAHPGET